MDYLFFDIESAHGNFSKGVMCSFGYVLCNDNFDIIQEDDILINPELEKWDWYVVKNILPYSKNVYNSMSNFPKSKFSISYCLQCLQFLYQALHFLFQEI